MFPLPDKLAAEMTQIHFSRSSREAQISVSGLILQCRLHTRGRLGSRTIFVFRWRREDQEAEEIYHLEVEPSQTKIEALVANLRQDGDDRILEQIMAQGVRQPSKPRRVDTPVN